MVIYSTLHIWWARRPLAGCRAAVYAALRPAPTNSDQRRAEHTLIADLVKWEVTDPATMDAGVVAKAKRNLISPDAKGARRIPVVLDPFAGGGAIPLEAERLGCHAIANDLNPVAHIIQLATLEYAQNFSDLAGSSGSSLFSDNERPLIAEALEWSVGAIRQQVERDVKHFYQSTDGEVVIGYIWARTIQCPNPACRVEIPLMGSWWLCKKPKKKVALKPITESTSKIIEFEVLEGDEIDFDPHKCSGYFFLNFMQL